MTTNAEVFRKNTRASLCSYNVQIIGNIVQNEKHMKGYRILLILEWYSREIHLDIANFARNSN